MAEPAAAARDERLAQLLADLVDQHKRGEPADVESVARQHPEVAGELRALWAAVLVTDDLARPGTDPKATIDHRPVAPVSAGAPDSSALPHRVGDYELLAEIGRGAMGVVYKARQTSLGRLVAVKMLLGGDNASGVDLARFRAEAEAAARLEHPHVVPVYEVGECEGRAYFSMKYLEGTTLAKVVASGPLPAQEAARYLVPICQAVHHAHQQGILHRDLKPSNILFDTEGRAHVSDFGLAKRLAAPGKVDRPALTMTGAIVGTPSYMAPEQAFGGRGTVSPASDIYSLGAILYEMLTGRPPFQGATHMDTLLMVREQEPVPPRLLNRSVNRELELICLKCLQKPPELRYGTAAQLGDDLEAFLRGDPTSVRSSGVVYHVSRLLSETHHAAVLENWGLLWMWHSLALVVLCSLTNWLYLTKVTTAVPYLVLWVFGLGTWASIFWALRKRAGPVTFVEKQIAHVWAAGTIASISLFWVEMLLRLPVLKLSPVLAILAGMNFLVKAGTLSGFFYLPAAACFATTVYMALVPEYGLFVFGLVSAAGFFIPGIKYYRQQRRASVIETADRAASELAADPMRKP
jgi:serine/threonine-protein kinase